jgi:hypothetical protein
MPTRLNPKKKYGIAAAKNTDIKPNRTKGHQLLRAKEYSRIHNSRLPEKQPMAAPTH